MQSFPTLAAMAAALMWTANPVWAEPPKDASFDLNERLAMGLAEHRLDAGTKLIGWQLGGAWYLGHKDGKNGARDEALSLIWQRRHRQVSISTEGIRFTRRF